MNMASLTNKQVKASYFEARGFAKKERQWLVSGFCFNACKPPQKYGEVFWGRELVAKGVPFLAGKEIKDEGSKIILKPEDLKAAHEKSANGVYDRSDIALFIDAKDFSEHNGFKVIEEPLIIVVENPALKWGARGRKDLVTKIALNVSKEELINLQKDLDVIEGPMINYILDGIYPIIRQIDQYENNGVQHSEDPSGPFMVLLEDPHAVKPFIEQEIERIKQAKLSTGVDITKIETALAPLLEYAAAIGKRAQEFLATVNAL